MIKGVVVDGIGCGGKTQLILQLKSMLKTSGGYDVKELDHTICDDQFVRYLREYGSQDRILFHRSHISELVFGKLLRYETPFDDNELSILDGILSVRYICVLAEPPNFEIFSERMANRPNRPPFTKEQYLETILQFRLAFARVPHIAYTSSTVMQLSVVRDAVLGRIFDQSA